MSEGLGKMYQIKPNQFYENFTTYDDNYNGN